MTEYILQSRSGQLKITDYGGMGDATSHFNISFGIFASLPHHSSPIPAFPKSTVLTKSPSSQKSSRASDLTIRQFGIE
jgi:hypothetical protein